MKQLLKSLFVLIAAVAFTAFCAQAKDNDIAFEDMTYDFGTVSEEGADVTHEFVFTNNSSQPLTILSVSASCGCTRPKYDPKPLQPGEKGTISVTFKPAGQRGYVTKNVKVRFKTPGSKKRDITLKITGNVLPSARAFGAAAE